VSYRAVLHFNRVPSLLRLLELFLLSNYSRYLRFPRPCSIFPSPISFPSLSSTLLVDLLCTLISSLRCREICCTSAGARGPKIDPQLLTLSAVLSTPSLSSQIELGLGPGSKVPHFQDQDRDRDTQGSGREDR
jgi:hypothetical protein